ncbi:MAG: transglutaminase domain-containing protein [bacterium]
MSNEPGTRGDVTEQDRENQAAPKERPAFDIRNRIRSEADIEAQKLWQNSGDSILRAARRMFDDISAHGAEAKPVSLGLPETDQLLADLALAAKDSKAAVSSNWQSEIEKLRNFQTSQGKINVFDVLTHPDMPAATRLDFWNKEVAGLLKFTYENDLAQIRETETRLPHEPETESDSNSDSSDEEVAPPDSETMDTSMDKMEKNKEKESHGYFSIHPYFGGYFREEVFEEHRGGTRWAKRPRILKPAQEILGLLDERICRGTILGGRITKLPLPAGFVPLPSSLRGTPGVKVSVDEHGLYSLDASAVTGNIRFSVTIGKPENGAIQNQVEPAELAVRNAVVSLETRTMLEGLTGTEIEKARAIQTFVRQTLEYSNDGDLNLVYENHSEGYFRAIEINKKADCDVSNAYFINLLSALGIKARLAVGHYVKQKDHSGAAVMNSGSRHAWSEVWDDTVRVWVRLDATPPGDPTLDDEPTDEEPEDSSGEGDFGEQESFRLSDEELEELREKLKKELPKPETSEEKENREFAREAGCSEEEARIIKNKIEAARRIRDRKGRVIRDALSSEFRQIVETNIKEAPGWRGPVKKSEGEELDDVVMAIKDLRTGHADPLGYVQEFVDRKIVQEYGGFNAYFVFDRSGSMNDLDSASGQTKKTEQQLAGFLVLDGIKSFSYQTEVARRQNQLTSPLRVNSWVGAFQNGAATELKPLGGDWGPREQTAVWKGLESNVGGGTPAHLGLRRVREQIEQELEIEKQSGQKGKPLVRMVMVFMDGDVDDRPGYLAEQAKLEALGVSVSSWGMTASANAVAAFPEGHCLPSVKDIIEPVTEHIVLKAKKLRAKRS